MDSTWCKKSGGYFLSMQRLSAICIISRTQGLHLVGLAGFKNFFKGGAEWLNFAKYFFSSFDVGTWKQINDCFYKIVLVAAAMLL